MYARGNNGRPIYLDDRDRYEYLNLLEETVRRTAWHCMSYCLMDNHMHLLVETPRPNLGAGMQRLHGQYGRRFNDRYGARGHLFEGRFGAVRMKSDRQLYAALRYVALNPVEAGMCPRPEEYRWSSHAATLAGNPPSFVNTDRLFWYLAGFGGEPRTNYANLIEDALWL